MSPVLGFLGMVAGFVLVMGLVTHGSGTAQVINASSNGIYKLFSLELGAAPKNTKQA
jgi:hypothetical protein